MLQSRAISTLTVEEEILQKFFLKRELLQGAEQSVVHLDSGRRNKIVEDSSYKMLK